jgi:molecular chaperone GrpE
MSDPSTSTATNEPADQSHEAQSSGEDLATAIRQRDEYHDKLQRAHADFVNYQKRAKLQAEADRLYLIKPLALDILAALDNFDRAIETARAGGAQAIAEGLVMVEKQFVDALNKHGVEPIAALGQPFDPNVHEAIMQQPDASHPEGTVVAEFARGYMLNDRVIRPSKVAVSIPRAE